MELKLGSIPLRVQGWFLMMALMLGGANERDPAKLALWVTIVFVSVVVHELGHAMMGKAFGLVPQIELHGMGGTTSFQEQPGGPAQASLGAGKRIAISLAGPFAGFFFAAGIVGIRIAGFAPTHPLALHAFSLLLFVNVGWGIFNLFPMLPLDGGNVLRSVAIAITKKNGEKVARVVSIVVAAAIVAYAIHGQQWWSLYLGVLFAFQNVQALRQANQLGVDRSAAGVIEDAYAALDRGEPKRAIALLGPALTTGISADLRQMGLRIYLVALLKEEEWQDAMLTIEREKDVIGAEDLDRFANKMRELGRPDEADRIDALAKPPSLSEFRA